MIAIYFYFGCLILLGKYKSYAGLLNTEER